MWTTIVAQVAVAVAALPYALWVGRRLIDSGGSRPDDAVDRFVQATLSIGDEAGTGDDSTRAAATAARFPGDVAELLRRLDAEPRVAGVTFASGYPGHEPEVQPLEAEGAGLRTHAWLNRVDVHLFSVFDVPILAGRDFAAADAGPASNAVIVDRAFAEEVFGSGNVIGRRIPAGRPPLRRRGGGARSVARDRGHRSRVHTAAAVRDEGTESYQPLSLAAAGGTVQLAIRLRDDVSPVTFLGRAGDHAHRRALARAQRIDDRLRSGTTAPEGSHVAGAGDRGDHAERAPPPAAGIYAMTSFTVAARRKEIGIRSALGAAPGRVLAGIFRRVGIQLGCGTLLGLALAEAIPRARRLVLRRQRDRHAAGRPLDRAGDSGLLAALGPARRGLAIQPTEALKDE